jgi:hypothetical protein
MKTQEIVLPLNIPMFTTSLPNLEVATLDGNDFGSIPSLPGGFEVAGNKVIPAPVYEYRLPDGQLRLTLLDILVTVTRYQITANGRQTFWTGAQAAFTQYNSTQNNKGTHSCYLTMVFKNAGGGPQSIVYQNVSLTRDVCRLIGRINLPEVYSGKDLFNTVQSVEVDVGMTWDHEGDC